MSTSLLCGICLLLATQPASPTQPARAAPAAVSFASWAQTHVHPSVARIVAPGDGSVSYGSGTLIWVGDQQALVVTNWHVVNEATGQISVHFPDGFYSLGTVQSVDRDWDLAAIQIRRPPQATPVRLAAAAPQPGEMLTIAGYGSGQYRAASGPCTQYVAPGERFPFEMVELAASARQGDSGGPIFNSQGEMAGVLFGEGNGRTAGSYCGRVQWFLTSVTPALHDRTPEMVAMAPLAPVPERPRQTAPVATSSVAESPAASARFAAHGPTPGSTQWQNVPAPLAPKSVVASTRAPEAVLGESRELGWTDLAGETWTDQAKTVMAAVGVLLLVLEALRWLSRSEGTA